LRGEVKNLTVNKLQRIEIETISSRKFDFVLFPLTDIRARIRFEPK